MSPPAVAVGDVYGRLTITALLPGARAEVVCQCGTHKSVRRRDLWSGNTRSCGCRSGGAGGPPSVAVGEVYGRLTVTALLPGKRAETVCACGTITRPLRASLRRGQTTSCGCWRKDRPSIHHYVTHGYASGTHRPGGNPTPEYKAWINARQRVTKPNNPMWKHYGGRGIRMADEWLNNFPAFLAHIGPRPKGGGYSLDRIDNDGDYEPGNVRWATESQQRRNKRRRGGAGSGAGGSGGAGVIGQRMAVGDVYGRLTVTALIAGKRRGGRVRAAAEVLCGCGTTKVVRRERLRSGDTRSCGKHGHRGLGRLCSVPGCGRPHMTRGYCSGHYGRLRRLGDVHADIPLGSVLGRPLTPHPPGCGCGIHHPRPSQPMIVGEVFGRWTVTALPPGGMAEVLCQCGKRGTVARGNLRRGLTRSCGCLRRDLMRQRRERHGLDREALQ